MSVRQRRLLAFGTYPIRVPRHGGQRRCAALGLAHRRAGHHYAYACAYSHGSHPAEEVTAYDYSVTEPDMVGGGWATDVQAGIFSARNDDAFRHFVDIAKAIDPDTFILEQAYMWPLVKRLKTLDEFADVKVVYSSHNVEGPLKSGVLRRAGVKPETRLKVVALVDELEREAVAGVDLIIACSDADAATYRAWGNRGVILTVPNGIDPLVTTGGSRPEPLAERYALFVGSAHIPNRDGFLSLVLGEGLQYLPLSKCIAVAGGVSELIYHDTVYQRRAHSNGLRTHFYPRPTDCELSALIENAHVMMLPIQDGGGTNLKTAEALLSGKWVLGTENAFRGYERFMKAPGVLIANDHRDFAIGLRDLISAPPLRLTEKDEERRQSVKWEKILAGLDISALLVHRQARLKSLISEDA
jgi:hypothetical protein